MSFLKRPWENSRKSLFYNVCFTVMYNFLFQANDAKGYRFLLRKIALKFSFPFQYIKVQPRSNPWHLQYNFNFLFHFRILKFNPVLIFDMYNFTPPLILPKSKWGPAVAIDFVTCALMRVDIMPFANLMRVKQYPDLCKYLSSDQLGVTYLTFKVDRFWNKVRMMPQYCSRNPHKTVVPLASLTIRDMYMWE